MSRANPLNEKATPCRLPLQVDKYGTPFLLVFFSTLLLSKAHSLDSLHLSVLLDKRTIRNGWVIATSHFHEMKFQAASVRVHRRASFTGKHSTSQQGGAHKRRIRSTRTAHLEGYVCSLSAKRYASSCISDRWRVVVTTTLSPTVLLYPAQGGVLEYTLRTRIRPRIVNLNDFLR